MPKRRLKDNRGLPSRWRYYHGAYYYRVPAGMERHWDNKTQFRLGKTLSEAHKVYAERIERGEHIQTIAQLIDRYLAEVTPTKAQRTQKDEIQILGTLRTVFGNTNASFVRPKHCYELRDVITTRHGATSANRHLEKLSHVFTKAIEWGVIDDHPMKGKVMKNKLRPKRRYVEDWEIEEALKVASPLIKCYVRLKLLTGLRMSDMLSLRRSDIKEDGIHVTPRKTQASSGKKIVVVWDEAGELRQVLSDIQTIRPMPSVYLFCNRWGQSYIKSDGSANGFQSIWQRWMRKASNETALQEKFQERWLRTKVGSDSANLQEAADRLAHSNVDTTSRRYREKPTVVMPLVKPK